MKKRIWAALLCLSLTAGLCAPASAAEVLEDTEAETEISAEVEETGTAVGELEEPELPEKTPKKPEKSPVELSEETQTPEEEATPEKTVPSEAVESSELPETAKEPKAIEEAMPKNQPVARSSSDRMAYPVEGGNIYFNPKTGAIVDCDNSTTMANIPDNINGVPVSSIGTSAFYGCSRLTSVTIPNSITGIGASAFYGCNGLTSVTIPDSVTSIGISAFSDCAGLTSVTIPNTSIGYRPFVGCKAISYIKVTGQGEMSPEISRAWAANDGLPLTVVFEYGITSIKDSAFSNCRGLTRVIIPSSVISIGNAAFFCCSNLTNVTIPNSVTSIGYNAFYGCSGLTNVTIPNSVTSIGMAAFYGCDRLMSATISSNVTSIENHTFFCCSSLKNITIPNSVNSIGFCAFEGCSDLSSVNIPSSVSSIQDSAFKNCSSLTSITIPNSVTSIENDAFYGCSSLMNMTIPNSITSIGANVFNDCKNVSYVRITGQGEMSEVIPQAWKNSRSDSLVIKIEDGITSIRNAAFLGCSGLKSVTIPNSVTNIGRSAFNGCINLISISIPKNVTNIGNRAFYGCSNLMNVVIPDGVTSIEDYTFDECSELTSVSIPNSVTSIGNYAFSSCSGLTSVSVPNSVTSIGEYAFAGCRNLTSVSIPNSVTSIEHSSFAGCSGLTSASISNSVTSIGEYAFAGCSGLTSITIPNSVTSIEMKAFERCSGLTGVSIPNSVTSIGDYAFSGCTVVSHVRVTGQGDMPSTISSAWKNSESTSLMVEFEDGITSIGNYAFSHCSGLTSVSIPNSVTNIENYAFYGCSGLIDVYYDGSESKWNAITIESGNTPLADAASNVTIHYNSPNISTAITPTTVVLRIDDWNPETRRVRLSQSISTYQVTESASLPAGGLDALVGRYVLVERDYTSNQVTRIQTLDSRMGILDSISDFTAVIDGKAYPSTVKAFPFTYAIGDVVVYHLLSGNVVAIQVPVENTGTFEAWTAVPGQDPSGKATINHVEYPTNYLTDISFLSSATQLLGWKVRYWTLEGTLLRMEQERDTQREVKQFQNYNESSRTAFFKDGTSYVAADDVVLDINGLENRWVTCTIENIPGMGPRLTNIKKLEPTADVELSLGVQAIEFRDGKLRPVGGEYQGKSSFQIPITVTVSNQITVTGVSQDSLKDDDTLQITVNRVSVYAPDGFNFGWLSGGSIKLDSPVTLHPGESWTGEGYIRAGSWYGPVVAENQYNVNASADTSQGTEHAATQTFRVIDLDKQGALSEEAQNVAETAAKELDKAISKVSVILPDGEKMLGDFGITRKYLDLFKQELLAEIVMSNAPEKTFQQKVESKALEKVFGFKSILGVDNYTLPLTYVIGTKNYGQITMDLFCDITSFTLSGTRYALTANVRYKITSSEKECSYREGLLGEIYNADVDAFAKAAYSVAEAEIKAQYDSVWGKSANKIATLIFGDTVTAILKECDTSYKDIAWDLIVWPSKSIQVTKKGASNKKARAASFCPINIYVYDVNNQLCGAIENNQITKSSGDFILSVDENSMYVTGLETGYYVQYTTTENVVVDVAVTEFSGYEMPLRVVDFQNIQLAADQEYIQNVVERILPAKEEYDLTSETGTSITANQEQMLVTIKAVDSWAYTINSLEVRNSNTATVTFTENEESATGLLVVAAYASDGKMLSVSVEDITEKKNSGAEISLDTSRAQTVVAFIAEKQTLKPLCKSMNTEV